jgi:predicted peptidase
VRENGDRIDPRRVVIAGASMGAYGTWELAQRMPQLARTIVPMAGGGDPSRASRLNHTRIWAFHGALDEIVPVNATREMFEALLAARGLGHSRVQRRVTGVGTPEEAVELVVEPQPDDNWDSLRYTEFVRGGHHSAWDFARNSQRLLRWAGCTGCTQFQLPCGDL